MKHSFVPYELAVKLKDKGFNVPCLGKFTVIPKENIDWLSVTEQCVEAVGNGIIYGSNKNYNAKDWELDGSISAPLYQQVLDWFREKHDIDITICIVGQDGYGYWLHKNRNRVNEAQQGYFRKHDEALIEAIEKSLKLIP